MCYLDIPLKSRVLVGSCSLKTVSEFDQEIPQSQTADKVSKEAKIRNRYNQVPHLTQDITQESDKNTIKHLAQESQEVSPFPAGDHKASIYAQESTTNTKHN